MFTRGCGSSKDCGGRCGERNEKLKKDVRKQESRSEDGERRLGRYTELRARGKRRDEGQMGWTEMIIYMFLQSFYTIREKK